MSVRILAAVLSLGNIILASANVIIGFSLLIYILAHNLRSPVARAFCALMALTSTVYMIDIGMNEVQSLPMANAWLRIQWIGIAFVPAAYFHFADALLRTTGSVSEWRRIGVAGSYAIGLVAFLTAGLTNYIVNGVGQKDHIYHLTAGPGFWLFAFYYALITVIGWLHIRRARDRSLTSTSRRRMSYLMLAIVAPGIGVFPYLLIPSTAQFFTAGLISLLTLISNIGIALMTVVIGYIVAYQGVLLPDRVVKHNLLHFLLRGPLVAILVVGIMLTIPRVEQILGLPRDAILIITVAGSVVLLQVLISVAKPAIDRLIYRKDRHEIELIQSLDQRLLTTADLEQLLENTLIALCELVRAPSGFVLAVEGPTPSIRVFCGRREAALEFLSRTVLGDLLDQLAHSRQGGWITSEDFVAADGHWLLPMHGRTDAQILGILGITATRAQIELSEDDLEAVYALVRRAELALEDMRLQQQVFAILQGLRNELDQLQEWRSTPRYVNDDNVPAGANALQLPGLIQMVRDALSQFWGGPKLSQSPLLALAIVRDRLNEHDNVPAKAVRAVLHEAIERLRPSGERSMTASEWTVYNILDLRYVQGQRIRDIAQRLVMSESDFYRKQRVAIEQVAETLLQMEQARQSQKSS